ncbi:MAG: cytochrome d ubiquinol oxidase subunit II [Actinomycetales bacterium]|nr:cytochrome d ubiquinol oxidase subunit II [Actinomycetales bacterium]
MSFNTVWFLLIAVLWVGYFVLEGFDFGVGMLLRVIGRNEGERRAIVSTLGPLWDGNEVWVLVAGGATFAAFPEWYATLFSGFYLPLLLILVALILRGVSFEYRSKHADTTWRARWDYALIIGSALPALLWGVAFANIVRGVPLQQSAQGHIEYAGGFFNLLNPYALVGGLTTLSLFATHGCMFLALKTDGAIRDRANSLARTCGAATAVFAVVFLLWTQFAYSDKAWTWAPVLLAAGSLLTAMWFNSKGREGWAFAFTSGTITLAVVALFGALYPNVMPNIEPALPGLTIVNASSTQYTLKTMTIVAVVLTPIVLAYQAWTYWVFRRRLSASSIVAPEAGTLDYVIAGSK